MPVIDMKKRTPIVAVMALLLSAFALTACTGDGAGTETKPATTPETPTVTDPVTEPEESEVTSETEAPETVPDTETVPETETETETQPETQPETEVKDVKSWGDNILVSIPVWRVQWAEPEYMKLLQDAGVDFVVTVSGIQTATFDTSDKLIEAARAVWPEGETGIRVMVHNTQMGDRWLSMNETQVEKLMKKYIGNDAVAGYHIWDEPFNPSDYTGLEKIIKGLDPDKIADVNFLPGMVYGTYTEYEGRIDDYAKLLGDKASFLSFDNYPFADGYVDETALFGNFNAFRKASLANDVPTAFYLQAVGSTTYGYQEQPGEGQLYYHTGAALAYGFKWIKYWSWYVPDYGDPAATYNDYTDAIMGKDGKPTEMYEVAKKMHAEVHAIGPTLVNLAPTEVYHTGRQSSNPIYEKLPKDSFVSAGNAVYSIVSLMTDRLTGEHYMMVVNKNFSKEQTLTYTLDGVDTVWEISRETGEPVEMKLVDNELSIDLPAGGFALFRLPAGAYKAPEKAPAENVLEDARVSASHSDAGNGWFVRSALDGVTRTSVDSAGYRAITADTVTLSFDLGAVKSFNRLTVYPAGTGVDCGAAYPASVKLLISEDGETYTEVMTATPDRPTAVVPSFSFDAASARYVKLELTAGTTGKLEVSEIKLYDDGGKYTEETTAYKEPVIISGQNIALGKSVTASGSSYDYEGWGIAMITDGSVMQTGSDPNGTNGWMSNGVADRTGATWVCIDLGAAYPINRVVAYPRQSGERFPVGYYFEVSTDGKTWTKVAEETADPYTLDPRAFDFETTEARFVRMTTTEMHKDSWVDFAGGYMAQLSEIEVYYNE